MIKTEVVVDEGFEIYYYPAVEQKAKLRAELEAEFERVFAEKTAKLDAIIAQSSHTVEIEIPDEEEVVDLDEENTETVE